jgi:hypothetical protein
MWGRKEGTKVIFLLFLESCNGEILRLISNFVQFSDEFSPHLKSATEYGIPAA